MSNPDMIPRTIWHSKKRFIVLKALRAQKSIGFLSSKSWWTILQTKSCKKIAQGIAKSVRNLVLSKIMNRAI